MIEITTKAAEMLDSFANKAEDGELMLRVEIIGRGPKGFQYDLNLVTAADAKDDDIGVEVEGRTVMIAERSSQYLKGATLDFVETLMGGGFNFENPNPMWVDELSKEVAAIIESDVNPMVASHGGHIELLGVKDETAFIKFGGGCQGCGMVDVTLRQGVEVVITDKVDGISNVHDSTDHSAGTNPFY